MDNSEKLTAREFVILLFEKLNLYDALSEPGPGREEKEKLLLSDLPADESLERKNAARIIHEILKMIGIADLDNIEPAGALLDLYDCRVCVNHIAQVYLRGIMESRKIGGAVIFDSRGTVSVGDAARYAENIKRVLA